MLFTVTTQEKTHLYYVEISRYISALTRPLTTDNYPEPAYINKPLPIVPISAPEIESILANDFASSISATPELSAEALNIMPEGYGAAIVANVFTGEPLEDPTLMPIRYNNQIFINPHTLTGALIASIVLRRYMRAAPAEEKQMATLLNFQLLHALGRYLKTVTVSTPPKQLIVAVLSERAAEVGFQHRIWLDSGILETLVGRGITIPQILAHWVLKNTSPTMEDLAMNAEVDALAATAIKQVESK